MERTTAMPQKERKERYCVIAARVIIGKPCEYRAVLLKESQLPTRFDYHGVCRIFSVKEDWGWSTGSTSSFPELKQTVEKLAREVPDGVAKPKVIFIAVRPVQHDIDFREW